ncbi:MAG: Rieske (2Fe-2S) protein [Parvularculaceae bacterium]
MTFTMFGELAVVVRGKDGKIRAFHNVCRHRAARLVDSDSGNCGSQITCPYHAWTFQLDGQLTGVPYLEDYENFDRADHGLIPIGSRHLYRLHFHRPRWRPEAFRLYGADRGRTRHLSHRK